MRVSNPERCRAAQLLAVGVALLMFLLAQGARADARASRSLLLGGPLELAPRALQLDPSLPSGPFIYGRARPEPEGFVRSCSPRLPLCVLSEQPGRTASAREALSELEQAYERRVWALGLPEPSGTGSVLLGESLDLYLVGEISGAEESTAFVVGLEARPLGLFDEARAFCIAGVGISLRRAAAQCVGHAIALKLDAGATLGTRRAFASYVGWVAEGVANRDVEAVSALQRRPELSWFAERALLAEGSALVFEFLERHSAVRPSFLAAALLGASAGSTPPSASRFFNEPDIFDVLRRTLGDERERYASMLANFAISRALPSWDKGPGGPALFPFAPALTEVRLDWSFKASSLPRRVATTRPLEPNGAVYLRLELDQWGPEDVLGFEAEWEEPAPFKWSLVKLSANGQVLGVVDVPLRPKGRSVQQRLVELGTVKAVLVVGSNVGGIRDDFPFDPDFAPFEPHAATVYLARVRE